MRRRLVRVRLPEPPRGTKAPDVDARIARNIAAEIAARPEPFKPKRRTKAAIARERGVEPLANAILAARRTAPEMLVTGISRTRCRTRGRCSQVRATS
jgi:protein Tex